jgi:tetratricopeptide (TPR) repeat protein
MCGGDLQIIQGESVATCQYCGTQQTLPRLDDDKRANMYDRAGHFRRNNEYDKAAALYEQILNEDPDDAEAYWSVLLCKYGVEYVEDPQSKKRVPTVNRAQYASVFADEDYKQAVKHADGAARAVYEHEAAVLDEIQKGIIAISQNEKPFDVFICYKESDNNGRRTPDSVLAQELYGGLVQEGFKVFFSRITLEDKIGVAYEPYIFAALQSSRVMVAIGTKREYFDAVWVKNEWSRYLSLIKSGAKKTLIPAYRDMDPYDLPEEFSHLQAQDMGKLGFMQDLVRGIRKLLGAEETAAHGAGTGAATVIAGAGLAASVESLYKRAKLFLEEGDFRQANEYFDKILDANPEHAPSYLGKLCAELSVRSEEGLAEAVSPIDERQNFQRAMRFANDVEKQQFKAYADAIRERIAEEVESLYKRACLLLEDGDLGQADEYFDKVLDINAEYVAAYWGKVLVEYGVRTAQELDKKLIASITTIPATESHSYQKAMRFGSEIISETKDVVHRQRMWCIAVRELYGKKIRFGNYLWRVLAVYQGNALLITENVIKNRRFDKRSNSWEQSEIRNYLNGKFLEEFSANERQCIAMQNPRWPTNDQVHLLSIDEAQRFFSNDKDRIVCFDGCTGMWWLRSPGGYQSFSALVNYDGSVIDYGCNVGIDGGVRPALWLNLSSEIIKSFAPQDEWSQWAAAQQFAEMMETLHRHEESSHRLAAEAKALEASRHQLCEACGGKLGFGWKCKSCGKKN